MTSGVHTNRGGPVNDSSVFTDRLSVVDHLSLSYPMIILEQSDGNRLSERETDFVKMVVETSRSIDACIIRVKRLLDEQENVKQRMAALEEKLIEVARNSNTHPPPFLSRLFGRSSLQ